MSWARKTSRLTVLVVGSFGWFACGGKSQQDDSGLADGGAGGRAGAGTAAANGGAGGAGTAGAGTLGGAAGRGGTAGVGGYRACATPPDFSSPGFDCCVTICVAAAPNAGFTALTELGSFDFSYAWRGGVTGFTSQGFLDFTQSSPVATCGSADLRAQLSVVTFENYAAPPLGQQSVQISLASAMTTGTLDVLSLADSGILSGTLDVPAWRVHVRFEAPLCRDLYSVDR